MILWIYRQPSFLAHGIYAYAMIAAPFASVWLTQCLIEMEQRKIKLLEKKKGELKEVLKDTEKMLTEQLDPSLY